MSVPSEPATVASASSVPGRRRRLWLVGGLVLALLTPASYLAPIVGTAAVAASPVSPPAAVNPDPSMREVSTPGPTPVTGQLTVDTVWGPTGSPYVVSGSLLVMEHASLTMLPGTVVKFDGQTARITVNGQLLILGGPQTRVTLTSYKDDTILGDTNGDGDASAPQAGDYIGIHVYGASGDLSRRRPLSVIDYADVRFGGYGTTIACQDQAAIERSSPKARLVISNSRITDSLKAGVASGRVDAEGYMGIFNNYFAGGDCGLSSWQGGAKGGSTEIIGNTFEGNFNRAGAFMMYPRETRFWFNTVEDRLVAGSGDYISRQEIDVSFNELLGGLGSYGTESQQLQDIRFNWWGDNLNTRPLPGPCMSNDEARDYQVPLTTTYGEACPNGVLVVGYRRQVLPALSSPPPDLIDSVAEPYAPKFGPVDTYRGRLTYQADDLTVEDAGKRITATRTYRSHGPGSGDMGRGWRTSFSESLSTAEDGVATMTFGDDSSIPFVTDEAAGYVPQRGVAADFTSDATGSSVTTPNNTTYKFDPSGELTEMLLGDPGHKVDVDRVDGKVSKVTGVSGRFLDYQRDSGRLQRIVDSTARSVSFAYTDDQLTSATGVDGEAESYEYGAAGRLTKVLTPLGRTKLALGYDDQGRVSWLEQQGSGRADIEYDGANGRRVVILADGSKIDQYYDSYGRLVVEQVRGRSSRHVVYDGLGRVVADIPGIPSVPMVGYGPPAGGTLYDFRGDPVISADPLGWPITTTFNGKHKPVKTTQRDGSTIVRDYGAEGRVVSLTDPKGGVWRFSYTEHGQVRVVTDPLSRSRERTYETDGDLASETDETGATTTFGHDGRGRIVDVTNPRGSTWHVAYTAWDQSRKVTLPRGGTYETTFDADRMVRTMTDPRTKVTTYGYDPAGRVNSVTDAATKQTLFEYDAFGRPTKMTDPRGNSYTRDYTVEGWPKTTTDPDGVASTTSHDPAGRSWRVANDLGHVTQYVYDRAGQVLKVQTPDGATETRSYDPMGHIATYTSGINGKWTYAYDAFGLLTRVTDPLTKALRFEYDSVGRMTKRTDEADWVTEFGYDDALRTVTATDARGLVNVVKRNVAGQVDTVTDGVGGLTDYDYNADGALSAATDPEGGTTSYEYDLAGNLERITDPKLRIVDMDYDDLGGWICARTPTGPSRTSTMTRSATSRFVRTAPCTTGPMPTHPAIV